MADVKRDSEGTGEREGTQRSQHSRMSEGKFTPEQMIEALDQAGGVLAAAARALGCNRSTVYDYMKRHESVQRAYDDVDEAQRDAGGKPAWWPRPKPSFSGRGRAFPDVS